MTVRFTNTFPNNQTWRDRVQEGHANWPQAATGRPPVYFMMAGADWPYQTPCDYGDNFNGVHYWHTLPNNALAAVFPCYDYGHWNFQMVFRSTVSWWPHNSSPEGTSHIDLESVATHEFGHAYGWRCHFNEASQACNPPWVAFCDLTQLNYHTMCQGTQAGTLRRRTPEAHDIDTMWNAFAAF